MIARRTIANRFCPEGDPADLTGAKKTKMHKKEN